MVKGGEGGGKEVKYRAESGSYRQKREEGGEGERQIAFGIQSARDKEGSSPPPPTVYSTVQQLASTQDKKEAAQSPVGGRSYRDAFIFYPFQQ